MANTIRLKRSATASSVPSSGSLVAGELAVNTADGKLYLKKDDASIVQIGGPAAAGTLTGATLAAGVTASSLTSVGTLTAVNTSGVITGTNATASTSSTTGAVILSGGVGIAKDSFINGHRIGQGLLASQTNLAVGANTLASTIAGGIDNTAVGYFAGNSITTGVYNVMLGSYAGQLNTTGQSNMCIGSGAHYTNTTGSYNVAIGVGAGHDQSGSVYNLFLGTNCGYYMTSGGGTVCIGGLAGVYQANGSTNLTASSESVYIGYNAKGFNNSDSNTIVIGANAIGLGANTTAIGTSSTTSAKIWGAVTAAGTLTADAYILSSSGIQAKTANYTLVAADNGKVITMSVATANTLTVPASLDVGFNCTIIQIGAGQTTITASGTTLNSVSSFLKISAQHGSASIISYASNVYNVAGSLSA